MKTKSYTLLALGIFLFGCNLSPAEENVKKKDSVETTEHYHDKEAATTNEEHHHVEDNVPLTLNEGEKWIINDEMKPHIEASEKLVATYISEKSKGFTVLSTKLTALNTKLINSCTMKGASHEELHKWLHPHMELLEQLSSASSLKTANATISEINNSFENFHSYFR